MAHIHDLSGSVADQQISRFRFVPIFSLWLFLSALLPGSLYSQTVYEGNASANAIEGTAIVETCSGCANGTRVGNIGNGNANYLRIKGISVPTAGMYVVTLYYTEGTSGGARSFNIQINNTPTLTLNNLSGTSWTAPAAPVTFMANFNAGNSNSVGFFNATALAPDVDHIVVSSLSSAGLSGNNSISPATLVPGPNDDIVVNNFIPQGRCMDNLGITCTVYITDVKTNWTSPDFVSQVDDRWPNGCFNWWRYCIVNYQRIHLSGASSVALPKPANTSIANGITFRLKVFNTDRANATQQGSLVSMPGVWAVKTIGKRWGLHTSQQSPAKTGSGYDLAPWEPYTYPGNTILDEDVYYTFTSDGRVRIDKFTPYYVGTIWKSTYYIWEESINDGGWPSTWVDGTQNFLSVAELQLGGLGTPTSGPNLSGNDEFRQLEVYSTALTYSQMIAEENFDHNAGGNLVAGMLPCNTGKWMDSATITTPCGPGGNGTPVPPPPSNVGGFSPEITDSWAPVYFNASDVNDQFTFTVPNVAEFPPISLIQNPTDPDPWAGGVYPNFPISATLYLLTQDPNGVHYCQSALPLINNLYPGGNVLEAGLGANYPLQSLSGPDTIATAVWINPTPTLYPASGPISPTSGWTCTLVSN